MTIFIQSTLEMRGMPAPRFRAAMAELVEIVEREGWLLLTAIEQITGRLHTAIDIWRLPDLDAYPRGLKAVRESEGFPEMAAALAEAIEREVLVIGTRASWVPEGR